jgi:nucleoside-diphosphate-sugar epimerase
VKVLVTGAAGYLGEHVALAFRDGGHEVTALVRRAEQAERLAMLGLRTVQGDLLRPETWPPALIGQDAVVTLAGAVQAWSRDREALRRVNVDGTLGLVERAREAGIAKILVTSSLFALGPTPPGAVLDETARDRPRSPLLDANDYVSTKRNAVEKLWALQRAGHPVMLVYPSVLLGPGQRSRGNHTARMLADVRDSRLPGLIGDGNQVWNLVGVGDAGRGHVAVLERGRPGEGYFLGGENWTQRMLIEHAARMFGVKPPTRKLGRALPLAAASLYELAARVSGGEPRLTRGEIKLYDANWAFTSEKAERELGYSHEPLEPLLARTVAWIKNAGA